MTSRCTAATAVSEPEQRDHEGGDAAGGSWQEGREHREERERGEQHDDDERGDRCRQPEGGEHAVPAREIAADRETPAGRCGRVNRQAGIGEERERRAAHELLDDERREERGGRDGDDEQARERLGVGRRPGHDAHEQRRHDRRRRCGDGGERQRRDRRHRPAACGVHDREHEARQQDVRDHGRQVPGAERGEERRREHPRDGDDRGPPGALGEPGGAPPRRKRGERERDEVERHDRQGGGPERERTEHGEQVGEGVRGAEEAGADIAPGVADVVPELGNVRGERHETAAVEGLGADETAEGDGADDRREQHDPGAAAREESDPLARCRRGTGCDSLGCATLAQLGPAHAQRRDRGPADLAVAAHDAPRGAHGAVEGRAEARGELPADPARTLRHELAERTDDGERHEAQPVHGQDDGVRPHQAPVQLRRAAEAMPTRRGEGAAAEQLGGAGARDPRGRDGDDAVAGQPRAHAEVERRVDARQTGVEAAER